MSTIPQGTWAADGAQPAPWKRMLPPVLLTAALIGAVTAWEPVIAAGVIAALVLVCLALFDLSLVIGAVLLFDMLGEPYDLAYQSLSLGGLNIYANDALVIILAGALLLRGLHRGALPRLPRDMVSIVLMIFFTYGLLSLALSFPSYGNAAITAFRVRFLYGLLFLLCIPVLRDPASRKRLLIALLIGALGIGLLGIHNALTGSYVGGRTSSYTYRYLSSLQALVLFFGLSLLIGTVWSRRRPTWSFLLGAIYIAGILLSQARSIWLGAFFGLMTAVFGSSNWRRNIVRLALPIVALLALLIALGTVSGLGGLTEDIVSRAASFAEAPEDLTTVWRLFVWGEAFGQLRASPILGLGLGHRFVFWDIMHNTWEDSRQLHNAYLELAYASGFIAVGLFVLFQLLVLIRVLRAARRNAGTPTEATLLALASCQVCLAAAAFANVTGASMVSTIYVWVLSAVSMVEAREAEKRVDQGAASGATGGPGHAAPTAGSGQV
ncbi:MAG: O-antigen ligase family protein [Candidatus Eisenbacteria sp.]|nr:O-antigen ligase family protein [Candidatus Eisenbacteria bacterium]